jgi:hypothetical protein
MGWQSDQLQTHCFCWAASDSAGKTFLFGTSRQLKSLQSVHLFCWWMLCLPHWRYTLNFMKSYFLLGWLRLTLSRVHFLGSSYIWIKPFIILNLLLNIHFKSHICFIIITVWTNEFTYHYRSSFGISNDCNTIFIQFIQIMIGYDGQCSRGFCLGRGAHVMISSTLIIISAASLAEIKACYFDLKHSYIATMVL